MYAGRDLLFGEDRRNAGMEKFFFSILTSVWVAIIVVGCAHYPVNQPIKEYRLGTGYRFSQIKPPENSDSLLLLLTFSGGGTRAEQYQQSLVPAVTLSFTWLRSSLMR